MFALSQFFDHGLPSHEKQNQDRRVERSVASAILVGLFVGCFVAHALPERSQPASWTILAEVANLIRALIAAVGIRYFGRGLHLFDTLRGAMIFYFFAVVLAPPRR